MNNRLDDVTREVHEGLESLFGDKIDRIILYGSYARGDFNLESDIDIMVLMNCDQQEIRKMRRQISQVASRVGLRNDIMVSLLARSKADFEEQMCYQPFYQNIEKEGVVIFG